MPLIKWGPQLSVEVARFDDQHKQLVSLINELYDASLTRKGNEKLGHIINELLDYTNTHFLDEEHLMDRYEYPFRVIHKAAHDTLKQKVLELDSKIKLGQTVLSLDVLFFLKNWLTSHIQDDDMRYGKFFNSMGVD
jgi:hemerythrin